MLDQAGRIRANHLLLLFGIVVLAFGHRPILKGFHATGVLPSHTAATVKDAMERLVPGKSFECQHAVGGGWHYMCVGTQRTAGGESTTVRYAVKSGWRQPVVKTAVLPDPKPAPTDSVTSSPSKKSPAVNAEALKPDRRLNLNTAGEDRIRALPGMDPLVARQIVLVRTLKPFTTVDDLLKVDGVDRAMLEAIRPHVRVAKW
jgi:DNA uptake protein ComE-like DNA-binding protein